MPLNLNGKHKAPDPRRSLRQTLSMKTKVLNNIDLVYFVAWPKEKHTKTAAASQLLLLSKDQKCQPLGKGQVEEMYS